MAGPPKDVPPNELFLRLLQRPRPSEEVPFHGFDVPGARGMIRIMVLAKEDHDRARLVAHQQLKKNAARYGITALSQQDLNDEAIRGVVSDLAACEVIAMACHTVDPLPGNEEHADRVKYGRIFASGEEVGKTLTPDEVRYLFSAYNLVQQKYGPNETICLPEDINLWVRRLVEGAADFPFLQLSSHQWAQLMTMLAQKLYDLSGTLESQWENLPESLRSDLQTYCLGIFSSGEPAEKQWEPMPQGEISFEQAMRLANLKFRTPQSE